MIFLLFFFLHYSKPPVVVLLEVADGEVARSIGNRKLALCFSPSSPASSPFSFSFRRPFDARGGAVNAQNHQSGLPLPVLKTTNIDFLSLTQKTESKQTSSFQTYALRSCPHVTIWLVLGDQSTQHTRPVCWKRGSEYTPSSCEGPHKPRTECAS